MSNVACSSFVRSRSSFVIALLGALALAGCESSSSDEGSGASGASGGSGGAGAAGGAGGAGGEGACPAEGTGTIEIQVSGLPEGVAARVQLDGPDGGFEATGSETRADQPAGSWTIVVDDVTEADPIVRTVHRGSEVDAVCVRAGQTTVVEVEYSAIPTSGKLWATAGGEADASMVGFASETLAVSGSPEATVAAKVRPAKAYTFDRDGNLWVVGGTTVDPTLNRYSADAVATADGPAEVEITVTSSGCVSDADRIAFDAAGNLWLSRPCEDDIVRLTPAELESSGEVMPTLELGGVESPRGLAFDASGNLWVAAGPIIAKFGAGQLGASAAMPELEITLVASGSATSATADALAFDAAGNLWANVGANYNFARIAAADLAGTGAKDVAPANWISVGVGALPAVPAFDDSGALWFAAGADQIARLTPGQLTVNTTYAAPTAPAVVITSGDVDYANDIAFYPAAAGLPIHHSLP